MLGRRRQVVEGNVWPKRHVDQPCFNRDIATNGVVIDTSRLHAERNIDCPKCAFVSVVTVSFATA
ncbi:hypothetical protein LB561_27740 [Mesorhizobium sp. B292B1B]|uniref:hypothetical protein n=1 Tax=unclassified Mesorhizobium TaxID=325217 RepID=UPI00112CF930|nr:MULTISPECIES: hypothetical protein [unclassified Mesorhizobium]MBZ9966670.1 hypothetical protein [Mesorhizobium sp. BR1-1-2]MCA0014832.1 hypothetical protein [Mesorhizobium sp. B294B1A1]MCA0041047.1 hypothetical protein [Mesorhizobium sp. B292B1B]TPM38048.1 hypothetical protein FJ964_29425 [Mesorhizobium sp. B2-3-2]